MNQEFLEKHCTPIIFNDGDNHFLYEDNAIPDYGAYIIVPRSTANQTIEHQYNCIMCSNFHIAADLYGVSDFNVAQILARVLGCHSYGEMYHHERGFALIAMLTGELPSEATMTEGLCALQCGSYIAVSNCD